MLFNSWMFLVFFPVVTILYFTLPQRYRTILLLVASCLFYMAFVPYYILILAVTILIDYVAAIKIDSSSGNAKKYYLILSIISTCLVLFIFKYFNFFNASAAYLAHILHWNYPIGFLNILLPIGLSFHTFQSLSYVAEVYFGRQKPERNFLVYSLYVMFFPQLVAGPIERPQNLLPQFRKTHTFDYGRMTNGIKRMLWGLIKKVVIADNLAEYANPVYAQPQHFDGAVLLIATFFFAIQIYCDFSGYSDIAIGAARVLGFRLMENFNHPYFATSISDFWRRWHISLSTWFKDYVYIPLGGNRVNRWRWSMNILIVFLLSGLWHGANWTYVMWGGIHGMYSVVSARLGVILAKAGIFLKEKGKIPASAGMTVIKTIVKGLCTFLLVLIAWIFFRANSLTDAFYIVRHLIPTHFSLAFQPLTMVGRGHSYGYFLIALVLFLLFMEILDAWRGLIPLLNRQSAWIRWIIYAVALLGLMNLGVTHEVPFIYFQF